jgi:hypothetical protein
LGINAQQFAFYQAVNRSSVVSLAIRYAANVFPMIENNFLSNVNGCVADITLGR